MSKRRGRPCKYHSLEELRAIQRERSKEYYWKHRNLVLAKAKDKRVLAKQQNKKQRGEM